MAILAGLVTGVRLTEGIGIIFKTYYIFPRIPAITSSSQDIYAVPTQDPRIGRTRLRHSLIADCSLLISRRIQRPVICRVSFVGRLSLRQDFTVFDFSSTGRHKPDQICPLYAMNSHSSNTQRIQAMGFYQPTYYCLYQGRLGQI